MTRKMYPASITISRDSSDTVNIRIRDATSRMRALTFSLPLLNYAQVLTGLSEVAGVVEYCDKPEHLGKTCISEKRRVMLPAKLTRKDYEAWVAGACKEDGWYVDPHLGSQSSITHEENSLFANYRVYRYEDA